MSRARNNCARLPQAARLRVMELLLDGAGYDAVRRDEAVAAACAERGVTLHNKTLLAVLNGAEYRQYHEAHEEWRRRLSADSLAAKALKDVEGIDTVADMAQMTLLQSLRELAESGSGEPAELLKLTTAVTKIKQAASSDKIADLKQQLAATQADHAAEVARLTAEIETLKNKLAAALSAGNKTGLSPEALKDIEERAGLL